MAIDEHIRKGNTREILQMIWNRMGYSGEPGVLESDFDNGAAALIIALDAQARAAMQLQLERDCAIVCRYCRRGPALDAAVPMAGKAGRTLWRHPIVYPNGRQGYITCLANPIRHAWHTKESADGA